MRVIAGKDHRGGKAIPAGEMAMERKVKAQDFVRMEKAMWCPNCGAENPQGKKFCGDCGALIQLQQIELGHRRPSQWIRHHKRTLAIATMVVVAVVIVAIALIVLNPFAPTYRATVVLTLWATEHDQPYILYLDGHYVQNGTIGEWRNNGYYRTLTVNLTVTWKGSEMIPYQCLIEAYSNGHMYSKAVLVANGETESTYIQL